MTSTLVSWRSQDYVPGPIVAVLIADMGTYPKLPCSLVNGLQGFTYTVDLAQGVSVGQEENLSNVGGKHARCT